jgi:flagellar FliL protein
MAKPEPPDTAAAPPARRSRMPLIAGALAVVLAGGGGAGWFFFVHKAGAKSAPAEAHAEEHKPPAHVMRAGTVVVNIAGTEGKRYLRTTVEVGAALKDAKHLEEFKAPLLDAALDVLGTKPLPALLEPGDREPLREELRTKFNAALGHPAVIRVYLTEFLVQ